MRSGYPSSPLKVGQRTHAHLVNALSSPPTKLCIHRLLTSRELCPQTYSLSLPLEWSQVTHIPATIKLGRAHKPEKSAFYSTLPDNCVMIPIFQDGSLPFQYTHKHSSPLRQALHTQIANQLEKFFSLFGGSLPSSAQPHVCKLCQTLQSAAGHIKGTRPRC